MMIKKIIVIVIFSVVFCGCSCNRDDLINQNSKLIEENKKLEKQKEDYSGIEELFDWYNNVSLSSVNSFVLVESRNSFGNTLYSDGIVLGNIGLDYYILTDSNRLHLEGVASYRIMDSNASVYRASIIRTNSNMLIEQETGLMLLKVNVNAYTNVVMQSIELGEKTEIVANISSVEQINKIEILKNIKTSTIVYNNTSYEYYNFDQSIDNGSLINTNNELCGIFLSNINGFISIPLLKEIVYFTYSLVL